MKYLFLMMCWCLASLTNAQVSFVESSLAIGVYIDPRGLKDCPAAGQILDGKISSVVSSTGIGGTGNGRFYILPKLTVVSISKNATNTSTSEVVDFALSLYLCDNSDAKVIHSIYLDLRGVGSNKEDAIIRGVKKLDSKNSELRAFVEEGRKRIFEYYEAYCSSIIQKASSTSIKNIHKALEDLSLILPQNKDCFDEAQVQMHLLYSHYLNSQCSEAISKARLIWSTSYSSESAQKAVEHLNSYTITPECKDECLKLSEEMRARVEKNEEFDRALTNLLIESENKKMELDAEILKEIIRSQPKQVYNTEFIFVD
jgi:hypothetical protein